MTLFYISHNKSLFVEIGHSFVEAIRCQLEYPFPEPPWYGKVQTSIIQPLQNTHKDTKYCYTNISWVYNWCTKGVLETIKAIDRGFNEVNPRGNLWDVYSVEGNSFYPIMTMTFIYFYV